MIFFFFLIRGNRKKEKVRVKKMKPEMRLVHEIHVIRSGEFDLDGLQFCL